MRSLAIGYIAVDLLIHFDPFPLYPQHKDPFEFMHVNPREQGRNQQLPVGYEYDGPALVRLG